MPQEHGQIRRSDIGGVERGLSCSIDKAMGRVGQGRVRLRNVGPLTQRAIDELEFAQVHG
jgi:hypothetical protein